jgi:hypothetical protein
VRCSSHFLLIGLVYKYLGGFFHIKCLKCVDRGQFSSAVIWTEEAFCWYLFPKPTNHYHRVKTYTDLYSLGNPIGYCMCNDYDSNAANVYSCWNSHLHEAQSYIWGNSYPPVLNTEYQIWHKPSLRNVSSFLQSVESIFKYFFYNEELNILSV